MAINAERDGGELRVVGVGKRYGATLALDGVDLGIRRGEVHAVIGENGAGKSTLMNVLAGDVRADRGTMTLGGMPYAPESPHAARHRGVALIHQELSLCPHLTVEENVLLGVESATRGWVDRAAMRTRARALLAELPHPEIRPERLLRELSLPARQIVEICRALAADAQIILMDEPTSSLQGADVDRLFALIRRLASRGIAIVYISHFLEEVRQIADRYTVLRDGRTVATGSMNDATLDGLISLMVGRSGSTLFPRKTRVARGEVAVSVRGLSAPPRLHDASFELHQGEILGIAGLLGSGRTELIRALFGLDERAAGVVELRSGYTLQKGDTPGNNLRRGFGYLSEDRAGEGLALPLSITDNLCATRPQVSVRRLGLIDGALQHAATWRWIRELRIRAHSPRQPVRSLSGGNQQKVALGRLLHQEASILLLDEPTRGIDIGTKAEIYEIVARRAAEGGAVLLVSSYLPELFGLCDRLAVMCRGRLSPARPIEQWTPDLVLSAAVGS